MDYPRRLTNLQGLLDSNRLDALLVTHLPNVRYLSGFTGSSAALLVDEKSAVFFTDGRYTTQAKAEVQGARVVVGKKASLTLSADWLKARRLRVRKPLRLGIETDHMSVASHAFLQANLPSSVLLRPAKPLVEQARMTKDAEEVEALRAAVNLGAGLFDRALESIRPGIEEIKVAAEMEYAAMCAGAEAMSFPTIIASGRRSALPHGRASTQAIPQDGFVVCDFGVILGGYCSDMTRTLYVGRPSEEARQLYDAVREAQQAAVEAVRPGRKVGEVDQAARKLLQQKKLGEYFTHSTGHGVGLEIHEAPRLAAGQNEILRPGMVVTVEPGAYVPGTWGVRIEDMVLVTEGGCEILTPTSKEFVAI
jgi:Xaa-Pro aminopeptidase